MYLAAHQNTVFFLTSLSLPTGSGIKKTKTYKWSPAGFQIPTTESVLKILWKTRSVHWAEAANQNCVTYLFFHHLFVFIHDWYSYCIWLKAEAAVFHSCILVYLALLCSAFGTSMVHIKCPLQAANITYLSCSLLPILCFFWGNIRYCQYWGQKNTIKELDSLVGYTDRNRMEIITIKHSVMCLGPNNKNFGDWTFINWKSKKLKNTWEYARKQLQLLWCNSEKEW